MSHLPYAPSEDTKTPLKGILKKSLSASQVFTTTTNTTTATTPAAAPTDRRKYAWAGYKGIGGIAAKIAEAETKRLEEREAARESSVVENVQPRVVIAEDVQQRHPATRVDEKREGKKAVIYGDEGVNAGYPVLPRAGSSG